MQNFINHTFPSQITYGVEFGSEYQTDIVMTASGKEYRNLIHQSERKKFNLATLSQTEEEIRELIAFFQLVKGKLLSFRFNDILDNKISNQIIGTGDGKKTDFQIFKDYNYKDIRLFSKVIRCPVKKTLVVRINNYTYKSFALNEDGVISFKDPPKLGAKISVNCEFDTIVRFDNDFLSIVLEQSNLYTVEGLHLVEVL